MDRKRVHLIILLFDSLEKGNNTKGVRMEKITFTGLVRKVLSRYPIGSHVSGVAMYRDVLKEFSQYEGFRQRRPYIETILKELRKCRKVPGAPQFKCVNIQKSLYERVE